MTLNLVVVMDYGLQNPITFNIDIMLICSETCVTVRVGYRGIGNMAALEEEKREAFHSMLSGRAAAVFFGVYQNEEEQSRYLCGYPEGRSGWS